MKTERINIEWRTVYKREVSKQRRREKGGTRGNSGMRKGSRVTEIKEEHVGERKNK
jgi:hypothetical protein